MTTTKHDIWKKISSIDVEPCNIAVQKFRSFIDYNPKPNLRCMGIFNFLINTPSPDTSQSLKVYKSLDAYSFFAAGWVKDVVISPVKHDLSVIKVQVTHSQRLSAPPLRTWVIVQQDGVDQSSHCTCKAGLGETCSHVAAMRFAVECGVGISEGKTCPDVPCSWNQPSTSKSSVPCVRLSDINFTNPKKKRKMSTQDKIHMRRQTESPVIPPPTDAEKQALFANLHKTGKQIGILSLVEPYNTEYIPQIARNDCPKPLKTYFKEEFLSLDYNDLLKECDRIDLHVTPEQVKFVEASTRQQSKCALWHQMRSGRVTASLLFDVCRTSVEKPSRSLLNRICNPAGVQFSNVSTRWGCDHEKTAREEYERSMAPQHQNLLICDAGLMISQNFPFLGASPDGYVSCDCCGVAIIQIKCPYYQKDQTLEKAADDCHFCLENNEGVLRLKRTHRYFYQVQAQLGVTELPFCDFVVWTNQGCHMERILFDETFFNKQVLKVANYHRRVILPEILANWFSRNPDLCFQRSVKPVVTGVRETDRLNAICYCRKPAGIAAVVTCTSGICKTNQFHIGCLGLLNVPKRKWNCLECRAILRVQTQKSEANKKC